MKLFEKHVLLRIIPYSIGFLLVIPPIVIGHPESKNLALKGPSSWKANDTVSEDAGLQYFGPSPQMAASPFVQNKSLSNNDLVSSGLEQSIDTSSAFSGHSHTDTSLERDQQSIEQWNTPVQGVSPSWLGSASGSSQTSRLTFSRIPFPIATEHSTPQLWRYGKLFAKSSSEAVSEPESPYGEVSLILNPSVERKIRYFQTVIPDRFQEWLDRFHRYKPVVDQIFAEIGLPQELVYLSVIESGFNPRAYSRARAAGPWQFMKSTGRIYGLRVNWYVDERRDPIKSTVAAAQHLRDLYDRFGSWPLSLAAYNAGAGKITRAIRKSGTRDYWKIRRTRYIRRETREYVPKYMAATIIATNPTLFGFRAGTAEVHQYDEVRINNRVKLREIAKKTGLAFEDLRRLNPELRRSITPSGRAGFKDGYFLKVPVGMGYHVEKVRDELQQWNQPPPRVTWYRVRRGDSLSVIAQRFRMSVGKLKSLNNLSRNLIRVGQRLRVSEGVVPSKDGNAKWYRVRRGDSLWTIARRFSVSVRDLKVLNNLRSSVIRAGHMLMVSP